ncbi:MAG: prepilin-type N-terminal cleavage/methylation domain-containing protein [Geminicoccaceae bacterium]|nr:prepilin-type N-terminal cleavage/methylation domain-containing protein [Geminicoccaceae bacterium]
MRRSADTTARPTAGFTLVELLVALLVVALASAVIFPRFGGFGGSGLERTLQTVHDRLKDARMAAMRDGRARDVSLAALAAGLPAGITVEGEPERIVFLPNGATSGGRVTVGAKGGRETIAVDWLTGRIGRVDEPGGP